MAYSSDASQQRSWQNGRLAQADIATHCFDIAINPDSDRDHLNRQPQPRRRRRRPPARLPIDDTRIRGITELAPPSHLLREFPASERAAATTFEARNAIHRVLHGADDRLEVVVGPCSIHDYGAAIEYATRLAAVRAALEADLIIVMRVYFEKPRTTVGWKGLINDPNLDDSYRINDGLRLAGASCSRSTSSASRPAPSTST